MIFSFGGGGSKEETDAKSKGTQTEEEARASLESQTKSGIARERAGEEAFGEELTRLFDEETLELLRGLTRSAGGDFTEGSEAAGALNQFAGFLRERAAGTQEFFDERSGEIIEAAQARGESRVARRGTDLAQSAGSTFNTLVQRGIARDEISLDTELAALESNLAFQGRQAETEALAQAGQLSAAVPGVLGRSITDIVPLLRGGEVRQRQIAGGRTERSQFTLEDILAALSGDRTGASAFEREGTEETDFGEFKFGFEI